jgi:hypothetical protein
MNPDVSRERGVSRESSIEERYASLPRAGCRCNRSVHDDRSPACRARQQPRPRALLGKIGRRSVRRHRGRSPDSTIRWRKPGTPRRDARFCCSASAADMARPGGQREREPRPPSHTRVMSDGRAQRSSDDCGTMRAGFIPGRGDQTSGVRSVTLRRLGTPVRRPSATSLL